LKEQPLKNAVLQPVGRKTARASAKLARVLQEAHVISSENISVSVENFKKSVFPVAILVTSCYCICYRTVVNIVLAWRRK
jgi:hypothetical protein